VYIVNGYRGGKYGFASSHAANSFGAAMLIALLFRNRGLTIWMFIWAAMVSYSRIYLGVHYPGDILCGALIGVGSAYVSYRLSAILAKKMNYDMQFGENAAKVIKISVIANLGVLLIVACFYVI
jgi:undecaprenyl-diphosphatase